MKNDTIIKTVGLHKTYNAGKRNEVHALVNVNLEVRKGEILSIMGPSGSGKTTLLNILGALDKPTKGRIWIGDKEINQMPESKLYWIRRNLIGFVFQRYYLVPTLNVLENVLVPVLVADVNWSSKCKKALELLEMVGLQDRVHHKPNELSGGEGQRVAIARALIGDPAVVLADEPTGNLDSETGAGIIELMRHINKEKSVTFVIVTHDQLVSKETDRTVFLKDGHVS